MEFKDYYQVMGVERDANQDEIKRAYRKLARKYHPDVNKEADAEEHFKEVGEAYEVLKDPEKRAAYDQLGANWQAGQDFQPPPDWDQGFEFHGGGFTEANAAQFSDFFEDLFGRRGSSEGGSSGRGPGGNNFGRSGFGRSDAGSQGFQQRGEDTQAKIVIDLDDAYQGATRTLTLKHSELGADGRPQIKERNLNVKIPKGIRPGQHIRLAKQGQPGFGQGEAGDLYLEVEFRSHPLYRIEGKDVYLELPVTPWEAALGASIKTPTPSGQVGLKIPANSKAGGKLRLRGRGLPAKTPGDLYVVLRIELPEANSEADKAAYEEFAKAFEFNPRAQLGV